MKFPGLKMSENKIVAIVSPPYEEAEDRMKYKWQEGRVSAMMPYAYDNYLTRIAFKSLFL